MQTHDVADDIPGVLLGIEIEDRPFAKSTLQVFRAQLILHDTGGVRVQPALGPGVGLPEKAWHEGGVGHDLHPGRGAVKDTYNLLADGVVKLLRALAAVERSTLRNWAEAQGYERYLGSSIKGESAIDWSDKRARAGLLATIVADADRLPRQAQGALAEGSPERQGIVVAAGCWGSCCSRTWSAPATVSASRTE